jgi:ribosomal protein S18 acetylase RimI-like enzyme
MTVRLLTTSDLERAARVLSQAFADDPFVLWNFEHRLAELMPRAFELTTRLMTEAGTAYGFFEDAELAAVALYQAPQVSLSFSTMIYSGAALLYRAGGRTALRLAYGFNESERFKREAMRDRPFFYLDTVGVRPDRARRGIGKKLIFESLAAVRGSRPEPCFLLSQPHNLDYYLSLGFDSIHTRMLPKCNIRFHGMLERR